MVMEIFKTMTILFFFVVAFADASWTTTSAIAGTDTTAAAVVPPPVTINCQICPTGYYDGCNVCGCGNSATTTGGMTIVGFCTRRFCASPGTAYCHDTPKPPNPAPTPPVITDYCRICPKGYWDGCNSCLCKHGRLGACTKRACPPAGPGRPGCL
jgi:hypothetical protein